MSPPSRNPLFLLLPAALRPTTPTTTTLLWSAALPPCNLPPWEVCIGRDPVLGNEKANSYRSVPASYDRFADRRGEMRYAMDAFEQINKPGNQSEWHQIGFTRVGWREQDFKIRGAESGHTHFMTKLVLPGTI